MLLAAVGEITFKCENNCKLFKFLDYMWTFAHIRPADVEYEEKKNQETETILQKNNRTIRLGTIFAT